MTDVLSQTEVESLLAALDPGTQSGGGGNVKKDMNTQISVYDFKRPERVSKDQMRAFQALHDGFSRELGAALSGMLRTIVEVKLISADQLTYSEFVFSLENPTCFNLLHSEGLDGNLILDLNPSIIFPIVDRLLGGGRHMTGNLPSRPLTEIELRLVRRITDAAIVGLENAWQNICDLKLKVTQVESNPQIVQIVPPNEVVVLISFEITMSDTRGIMNLCVPFTTIEPLAGALTADSWSAYRRKDVSPAQQVNLEAGVSQAGVEMVVQLAKTNLTAQEFSNLAVGDVIVTEVDKHEPLKVLVEGRPLFGASPGRYRGHKAIQIGKQIEHPQEVVRQKLAQRGIDPIEPKKTPPEDSTMPQ